MSLVLNGSTQYAIRNNVILLNMALSTVVLWYKPVDDGVIGTTWAQGRSDGDTRPQLRGLPRWDGAEGHNYRVTSATTQDASVIPPNPMVADGNWRLAMFTANGLASFAVFDGDVANTTSQFVGGVYNVSWDRFTLGVTASNFSAFFNGKLAHVAVYDQQLLAADFTELLTTKPASAASAVNLVAYWPLVNNANDTIGSNDLTLVGAPAFDADDDPYPIEPGSAQPAFQGRLSFQGSNFQGREIQR